VGEEAGVDGVTGLVGMEVGLWRVLLIVRPQKAGKYCAPFPEVRMFFYEKWEVFKAAVRLRDIAHELSKYKVPGTADDLHQLRTNTSSIVLNLGEGAKARYKGKKIDRYTTSLGSAGEANANLIILAKSLPKQAAPLIEEGRELASAIAGMMTNLIKSVEEKWDSPPPPPPPPSPLDPPPPPPPSP